MAPSGQCSDSAPKIPDLQQYHTNYHDYHSAHFDDHTRTSYDSLPGGLHDPSDEEVKTSTCLAHSAGTQRSEDECSCSDGPRYSYAWPHAPDMEEKESDNNRRIGSHSRTPTPSMIEAKFMPSRTPTPTLGEPSSSEKPSPVPSGLRGYYQNVERVHHHGRSRSHSSERLTATISRFSDLGVREASSSSRKRHSAYPFSGSEHYRDDFSNDYEYKRSNREEKLEDEEDAKRERDFREKRRSRSERGGMGGNVNENIDFSVYAYEVKHLHDESPRSSNLRNRDNFSWEDTAASGPYRVRSYSSSSAGSGGASSGGGNIKAQPRPSPGCARGRAPTNGAQRRAYPIGTCAPCSSSSSSSSPPQSLCTSPRASPPHLMIPPAREDSYPASSNYNAGPSPLPSTRACARITLSSPLKTVTTLMGPPPSPHHAQCLLPPATSFEHCSVTASTVNSSSSTVPFQICSACLTTPFTFSSSTRAPPCVFGAFATSLPVSLHSSSTCMSLTTTASIPYSPHTKATRSSYAPISKLSVSPPSRASSYGSTHSSCSGSSLASAGSLPSFACPGCSSSSSISLPLPPSSSSSAPSTFPLLSSPCPPIPLPTHVSPLILPTEPDSRPSTPTTDTSSTPTSQRSISHKSRNKKQRRKPSGHNRIGSSSQKLSGKEERDPQVAGYSNDNNSNNFNSNDSASCDASVDQSSNSSSNSSDNSTAALLHIRNPCSPAVSSISSASLRSPIVGNITPSSPAVSLDSVSSFSSNFLQRNSNVFSPTTLSSSSTPVSSTTPISNSSSSSSSFLLPSQRGNHSCSTLVEESSSPSSSSGFPPSVIIHSPAPAVMSPSFLARGSLGTSNSTVSSGSSNLESPAAVFHVRSSVNSSSNTPTSASTGPTLMPSRRDSAGGSPLVSRRESIVHSFVTTAAMLRRDSGSPPLTSRRDSSSSTLPVSFVKARRTSQSARRLSSEWEHEEVQAARRASLPSHDFGFEYGPIKNRKCVVHLSDSFGGGDVTVKCSPDATLAELQALAIQKFQKANRKSSSSTKEKFWRLGRSHTSSPTSQSPEPSDHESPWYQALSHARRQPPSPPVITAKSPSRPSLSGVCSTNSTTSFILGDSRRASVTSMRTATGGGLRAVLPHPTNHEDGKLGFRNLVILLSNLRQKNMIMETRVVEQLDHYDSADLVKAQDFLDQLEQKPPLGKSPFLYPLPADLEDCSKVICTQRGYESVMRFLSVEYSQENLEFWKAVTDLEWKFTRPEVQVIDLRKQAQALYHTFIDSCSVHTVNVSSATANAFRTHLMDPNIPMETLLQLCESAKDEIVRLLKGDSFRRYQESKFYKILVADAHKYHAKLAKKRR